MAKLTPEQRRLSDRLGHEFKSPDLLVEALTHASLSSPARQDNQRLEFLGDRVLGLTIAEALLANDPEAAEGVLAPRLNALVRKETCAEVAQAIGLGDAMLMGRAENASGGRRKQALLADAMEAVIAAVYLDGGFGAAKAVILSLWKGRFDSVDAHARDPKTALQEWAQARGLPPPSYTETGRSGPDHAPVFQISVQLTSGQSASGTATSKRAAQQEAATKLLDQVEGEPS
ncbi:MAG: ribonuclease III [Pseudomonadota bacterium]